MIYLKAKGSKIIDISPRFLIITSLGFRCSVNGGAFFLKVLRHSVFLSQGFLPKMGFGRRFEEGMPVFFFSKRENKVFIKSLKFILLSPVVLLSNSGRVWCGGIF